MTYGERHKRADTKQIIRDMDKLESAFVSKTQKLNEKRQDLLNKKLEKLLPQIEKAFEKGDSEEVDGLIESIRIPSGKEWRKQITGLVDASAKAGVLRAHLELLNLKRLYTFAEDDWSMEVIDGGSDYSVVFPPEAQKWIREYGYQIGSITEDTVRQRIRDSIEAGLTGGYRGRDLVALVREVTDPLLSQGHADTIARTETAKMYNAGRLARWLDPELDNFVEALMYDSIIDLRTTDLCKSLDGKTIAVSNSAAVAQYTPPNHFRCRATWIPVTKFEEWTDDFPTDLAPQKGFQFEAPLPKLLKGKKEPLVQPKEEVVKDPREVFDKDIIRTMNDDDFKLAIGNVSNPDDKLAMVQERAEQMLKADKVFTEVAGHTGFQSFGDVDGKYTWIMNNEVWKAPVPARSKTAAKKLFESLNMADAKQAEDIVEKFAQDHGKKKSFMGFIAKLREAVKMGKDNKKVQFNGLKEIKRRGTFFGISKPPLTPSFRDATGLRKALDDGESWMEKYLDDRLTPATGIKLKYNARNTRAYATGANGEMFFGKNANDAGVVVHESGHIIHWNNKAIADLTSQFYLKRTKASPQKKEWTTSAGKEWAYPDDFINYYTGREYGWEKRLAGSKHSTGAFLGQEVISMGLQHMHSEPENFYKKDKDHFLFIYAIMKGLF